MIITNKHRIIGLVLGRTWYLELNFKILTEGKEKENLENTSRKKNAL